MDHAEALDRITDLAQAPELLGAIDTDPSPGAAALRAHIAACDACASELSAWRRTWSAMAHRGAGDPVPITTPTSLRDRTLRAVAAEAGNRPREIGAVRPGRRSPWPWLTAAAIVLALGAAGFGLVQEREAGRVRSENEALVATTAALGDVLADPSHLVTSLRAVDGGATGTVAWTDDEVVVVASGLPALEPGRTYRCWVERDGVRTPIGPLSLSGSTAYWVASTDSWGELLRPGATFGVSVTSEGGASTPVLLGEL